MIGTLWKTTRPSFLILPPACVLLGAAAVRVQGYSIDSSVLIRIVIVAVFAHIAVNVLNEYLDFRSGIDLATERTPFSGGSGALPAHPQAASAALFVALMAMVVMVLVGITLLGSPAAPWLYGIGLAGVFVVVAYTRLLNRSPLACLLAPGIGFGLLMVNGTGITLAGEPNRLVALLSLVPFFQVNNLLLLNQFPDAEADRAGGRRHALVVWGERVGLLLYGIMALAALVVLVLVWIVAALPLWFLLSLIPAAAAIAAWVLARQSLDETDEARAREQFLRAQGLNVVAAVLTPALAGALMWFA